MSALRSDDYPQLGDRADAQVGVDALGKLGMLTGHGDGGRETLRRAPRATRRAW